MRPRERSTRARSVSADDVPAGDVPRGGGPARDPGRRHPRSAAPGGGDGDLRAGTGRALPRRPGTRRGALADRHRSHRGAGPRAPGHGQDPGARRVTRRARSLVALAALGVLGAVLVVAVTGLEPFGPYPGPYGDVLAKVVPDERHTGQLVAATVFDYRGFDTLGEEMILFAAVCGCAALLRVLRSERDEDEEVPARPVPSFAARAMSAALVGPVMVLGAYVVAHGHLTPGGGFSGGVVVAGALLLAYAGGQGLRLRRVGSITMLEGTEALGAAGFLALALAGLIATGTLLKNFLALGTSGMLLSAGTIPVGNVGVGLEVAGAVALVVSEFLEQALLEDPE